MEDYTQNTEVGQSKYNSALAQQYRLNDLWEKCHLYAFGGNFKNYKFTLDRIWVELAPEATPEQIKNKKQHVVLISNLFKENEETLNASKIVRNKLYGALQGYEIFLRKVLNSQGKGIALKEDTESVD